MLRYLTAGESHGQELNAIIEGFPANLRIDISDINDTLAKRQMGYGRGERMKIERDTVEITAGVRDGKTLGSPICLKIKNRDWENWKEKMNIEEVQDSTKVTVPRPGHADLTGAIKYKQSDLRNILERSSARETAIRTAVGCIAQQFLTGFGINVLSYVTQIGKAKVSEDIILNTEFKDKIKDSLLRCPDMNAEKRMIKLIDEARQAGDTLGGVFEVNVFGLSIGLGSCMHYDRKLDARIALGLMSIQGIKGVEFGSGFEYAKKLGSESHDEIYWDGKKYYRKTNNAGGIEGGMSNGEMLIVRAAMKPIPTLYSPLNSVDIITKAQAPAQVHRSDTCAVPAASIVGQSVVVWEIACAFVEKFGGDSIEEIRKNYNSYMENIK